MKSGGGERAGLGDGGGVVGQTHLQQVMRRRRRRKVEEEGREEGEETVLQAEHLIGARPSPGRG